MAATATKSKKKTETVHIALLLDESGSMGGNEEAVIGGVNQFVAGLSKGTKDKDMRATLAMFDQAADGDNLRFKFTGKKLAKVDQLTASDYAPRGATPLNDAVIGTIKALDKEVGKNDKAMVVIFTDGYENASETKTEDVRKAIKKKEKKGWEFIYLGANQDAWAEGGARGVSQHSSFTFNSTPEGTRSTIDTVTSAAALYSTSDSATYKQGMKGMSNATGGQLEDGVVLDASKFVNEEKTAKRKKK